MRKYLIAVIILFILSFNIALAVDPPPFFGTGLCSFPSMGRNGAYYDCFADTFLYYLGSIDESNRQPYQWDYRAGSDPNYPSSGPMNLFRDFLAPFIALGVVTYGFMSNINIFGRKNNWINLVMAVLMMFSIFPTGVFEKLILNNVLRYGSRWAFALWKILFVVGTWSIFRKNFYTVTGEADQVKAKWQGIKNIEKEIRELRKRRTELTKALGQANVPHAEQLRQTIVTLTEQIDKLEAQQRDLEDI